LHVTLDSFMTWLLAEAGTAIEVQVSPPLLVPYIAAALAPSADPTTMQASAAVHSTATGTRSAGDTRLDQVDPPSVLTSIVGPSGIEAGP
jgi:hypothetical protein